jgi:hypothetical protein
LPTGEVIDARPRVNLSLAIYAVEVAADLLGVLFLRSLITQPALWAAEMDGYLGAVAHPRNMRRDSPVSKRTNRIYAVNSLPQSN